MVVAEVPLWVVHGSNTAPTVSESDHHHSHHSPAASLALYQGRQKSAIYGLDVHPPLLATAGGDGTVRLWNTNALFANKHPSQFREPDGAYVSSSSSSSEEDNNNQDRSATNAASSGGEYTSGAEEEEQVHDLNNVVRRKTDGAPSPQRKSTNTTAGTNANGNHQPQNNSKNNHHHAKRTKRLICTLSAHTGSSVLAVRFSPSGKFLASAGDDACVCIYTSTHSGNENTTSSSHSHYHPWHRILLLRGHGLDVVDLAWAPDDSHLVSCSLDKDTPIIVWKLTDLVLNTSNASATTATSMIRQPYKILGRGVHTSTVKGVAFDPAGSYLASSGDDPAVCIWRAHDDDWGLEQKIDASAGIFRSWNVEESTAHQSMFRRLSWSTDGSFICATNAVVKNKHVASTIARDGWAVSGSSSSSQAGAANLVGHKQPVVVSRHASQLLQGGGASAEGNAATLVALGDRKGFVTVWSTRKSRPIFKLQCSETRCTVTDLAWGRMGKNNDGDMMLLVSLLDGQVVALRFAVPTELGPFLSASEHARVFQLRYGIDLGEVGTERRLLVGKTTGGTELIENALQMTLEGDEGDKDTAEEEEEDADTSGRESNPFLDAEMEDSMEISARSAMSVRSVRDRQEESRSQGGKKRVRPVLMTVAPTAGKRQATVAPPSEARKSPPVDPTQSALEAAEKASAAAAENAAAGQQSTATPSSPTKAPQTQAAQHQHQPHSAMVARVTPKIPHSTDKIHTVNLPVDEQYSMQDPLDLEQHQVEYSAVCTNSSRIPIGSKGSPVPCMDLVIKKSGKATWKEQIPGATCSAIAASKYILALGTTDGCVQFFGSSPTKGWACGTGFRSHAPVIFGSPIVMLKLQTGKDGCLDLLVVTSEGNFGVYTILPSLSLHYKGTLLPAMMHMSSASGGEEPSMPKLSRLQITDSGRLLLLLSSTTALSRSKSYRGVGGSMQAFVYDQPSELWLRVADSRFILSNFYSSLPSGRAMGELTQMDDAVKLGSLHSSLESSHRNQEAVYTQAEQGNYVASRAHCEDRMACAMALGSASEFKYWLGRYVRTLAIAGDVDHLRMLVDMFLAGDETGETGWWLSSAPDVLTMDRRTLVKTVILAEMSKNRALQRITNEVALEVENM